MSETQAQREARWAAERARQAAYAESPEAQQRRLDRIASGLCVVSNGLCITHLCVADFGHYLTRHPEASTD